MRVVVQKCLESNVSVDGRVVSSIDKGLLVLVGFTDGDNIKDIDYLVNKVVNLRIFEDDNGIMNLSVRDIFGADMKVSLINDGPTTIIIDSK